MDIYQTITAYSEAIAAYRNDPSTRHLSDMLEIARSLEKKHKEDTEASAFYRGQVGVLHVIISATTK